MSVSKGYDGTLTLEIRDGDTVRTLRTLAPFADYSVDSIDTRDEGDEIGDERFWVTVSPQVLWVDLTVKVRLVADSTPGGVLYQIIESPPAPHPSVATLGDIADRLREMVAAGAAVESIRYALAKVADETRIDS